MKRGYLSSSADDLEGKMDLKVSLGDAESTFIERSRQFDLFCTRIYPTENLITKALSIFIKRIQSSLHIHLEDNWGFG